MTPPSDYCRDRPPGRSAHCGENGFRTVREDGPYRKIKKKKKFMQYPMKNVVMISEGT